MVKRNTQSYIQITNINDSIKELKIVREWLTGLIEQLSHDDTSHHEHTKQNKRKKMFNIIHETWNPITGCLFNCKYCWARRLALTKLRHTKRYRKGFLPSFNENEFKKKFRKRTIVFVSDMGDMWGDWVPRKWILEVLQYISMFPETLFLFLTKNPRRYHEFLGSIPQNSILGSTIETNRDHIASAVSSAPPPSKRYLAMKELNWPLKFISIEPILEFDLPIFLEWIIEIEPLVVYIGYDNYKNWLNEPLMSKTLELIDKLKENGITVVTKTIRPAWYEKTPHLKMKTMMVSKCSK